jgi:hypothetical protein
LPLRTQGVDRGHTEVPPGAAHPPASGPGSRSLGSDAPPRNPSRRLAVGRSPKPPGRATGWIFGCWERCRSGPSGTHCHPETWELVHHVRRHAPSRSSSVAGSHGECAACPCGRCMAHLVGHDGREFRPSGRQMAVVAQIRSRSTSPPVERTRRLVAADRKGRSCGAMHLALSTRLFRRSRGFPLSCR